MHMAIARFRRRGERRPAVRPAYLQLNAGHSVGRVSGPNRTCCGTGNRPPGLHTAQFGRAVSKIPSECRARKEAD